MNGSLGPQAPAGPGQRSGLPIFSRLRIAGFKSFAEAAVVDILPGLTGIVGPNGCGKSNVVEALRWVMGESSARSMRGAEMDDVIFAGTTSRPSRNLAEVVLTLEGAPPPFDGAAELQVVRRLERGAGSSYRLGGREVRARDVQTLFADLASGARSSAMVSQGRVSALINARPEERRQVLEEAAGITGLHARRHEAELKLRAAETNLERAEDGRGQIEAQLDGLRRQARQAARYRALSGLVREAEAEWFALLLAVGTSALDRQRTAAVLARRLAAESAASALEAARAAADGEAALPEPRAREADARSVLERRRVENEGLEQAEAQAATALAQAERHAAECAEDLAHALAAQADAAAHAARLAEEVGVLDQAAASLPERQTAARRKRDDALAAAVAARAAADALARRLATAEAASLRVGEALQRAQQRAEHAAAGQSALVEEERQALAALVDGETLEQGRRKAADAAQALLAAREAGQATREAADASAALRLAVRERLAAANAAGIQAERERDAAAARATRSGEQRRLLRAEQQAALASRVAAAALREAERMAAAAAAQAAERAVALEAAEAARLLAAEAVSAARQAVGEAAAERRGVMAELAAAERRAGWLAAEAADAEQQHRTAQARCVAPAALSAARREATRLAAMSAASAHSAAAALQARQAAATRQSESGRLAAERMAAAAAIDGEAAALRTLLTAASRHGDSAASAGELMRIPAGLERAVASALGATLRSVLDTRAGVDAGPHWRLLDAFHEAASLPAVATPLGRLIDAPPALAIRALRGVGLIEDGADGASLQASLRPGQTLVRRDGAAWRWDGHVLPAGEDDAEAQRLRQRNRLRELEDAAAVAAEAAAEAQGQLTRATSSAAETAQEASAAAEAAQRDARTAEAAAVAADALAASAIEAERRLAALAPERARLDAGLHEAEAARQTMRDAAARLLPPDELAQSLRAAEAALQRRAAEAASARDTKRAAEITAGAARAEAEQLARQAAETEARLAGLAPQLAFVEAEAADAEAALATANTTTFQARPERDEAGQADHDADTAERAARTAAAAARAVLDDAEAAAEQAGLAAASLERAAHEVATRHAALRPQLERAADAAQEAAAALLAAQAAAAELPDLARLRQDGDQARLLADEAVAAETTNAIEHDEIARQGARDAARRQAADAEAGHWTSRVEQAAARQAALSQRHVEATARRDAALSAPAEAAARHASSARRLAAAEREHTEAAAVLLAAEAANRAAEAARHAAAAAQAARRETLLRAEAAEAQSQAALDSLLARARERNLAEARPAAADCSEEAVARAARKFERLAREREEIGPVNLLAEAEAAALSARADAILAEREELATAIASLRGSIGHLNREGRERLSAMFEQVDRQFQAIFGRMFNGGRAHLALVGSDDVLAAGLEIYVQPPGKKLATLSLLSGGEQALTALSLIFAMFRCNPAPVCVLDEVDAPLDDANVDRFCGLLEDMVRDTGVRFLVVTHHQLTMARMDRLYGVTMQERGVSRLLSVDLVKAAQMVETRQAAE